jgi:hypothetical protein
MQVENREDIVRFTSNGVQIAVIHKHTQAELDEHPSDCLKCSKNIAMLCCMTGSLGQQIIDYANAMDDPWIRLGERSWRLHWEYTDDNELIVTLWYSGIMILHEDIEPVDNMTTGADRISFSNGLELMFNNSGALGVCTQIANIFGELEWDLAETEVRNAIDAYLSPTKATLEQHQGSKC